MGKHINSFPVSSPLQANVLQKTDFVLKEQEYVWKSSLLNYWLHADNTVLGTIFSSYF